MRKLIVSMNVTLDGFMSGPQCELDWHFQTWNDEMAESASLELSKADTILLGRVTYRAMARYWPMQAMNIRSPREDISFADMMNSYRKVVFSKTLEKTEWNNSRIEPGNIPKVITLLKQQPGKNIIVYGSGKLVCALRKLSLVDEYQLWVHPVFLGKGKSLFAGFTEALSMKLFKTKTFSSGVVMLYYAPFSATQDLFTATS